MPEQRTVWLSRNDGSEAIYAAKLKPERLRDPLDHANTYFNHNGEPHTHVGFPDRVRAVFGITVAPGECIEWPGEPLKATGDADAS